jgi:hypothetical protein
VLVTSPTGARRGYLFRQRRVTPSSAMDAVGSDSTGGDRLEGDTALVDQVVGELGS